MKKTMIMGMVALTATLSFTQAFAAATGGKVRESVVESAKDKDAREAGTTAVGKSLSNAQWDSRINDALTKADVKSDKALAVKMSIKSDVTAAGDRLTIVETLANRRADAIKAGDRATVDAIDARLGFMSNASVNKGGLRNIERILVPSLSYSKAGQAKFNTILARYNDAMESGAVSSSRDGMVEGTKAVTKTVAEAEQLEKDLENCK